LRDSNKKIIEAECFVQNINEFESARWGMMTDVTERSSYTRAVENMPTGFYRIEHNPNDKSHKSERLTQCNDRFAKIFGFPSKKEALGVNVVNKLHYDEETGKKFFQALHAAAENNVPLLDYYFKAKRYDSGELLHISLDVHLLKDSKGSVIGREGTIRDLTEKVKLSDKAKEAEKIVKRITEDIDNFIHTFLHPVVQFTGNSELLNQVGKALHQSVKHNLGVPTSIKKSDIKKLGQILIDKLIDLRDIIPDSNETIYEVIEKNLPPIEGKRKFITMGDLRETLTRIINTFDYSLKEEESEVLLEEDLRITALLVLDELNRLGGLSNDKILPFIKKDFIEFLHDILFSFLLQCSSAMQGETESMKRGVETLRDHIVLRDKKEKKEYNFQWHDIGQILEKAILSIRASLLEKQIETDFKKGAGDLNAMISQTEFERVISNLLHNAGKYSTHGKGRFIRVRVKEIGPTNNVEIKITNFGVPIKKEEIENEDIWRYSYRGTFARRYNREGTGIGLADAKEVIQTHGGTIAIESNPSRPDGPTPQYKVPYITTVTILIPKRKTKRPEGEKNV